MNQKDLPSKDSLEAAYQNLLASQAEIQSQIFALVQILEILHPNVEVLDVGNPDASPSVPLAKYWDQTAKACMPIKFQTLLDRAKEFRASANHGEQSSSEGADT